MLGLTCDKGSLGKCLDFYVTSPFSGTDLRTFIFSIKTKKIVSVVAMNMYRTRQPCDVPELLCSIVDLCTVKSRLTLTLANKTYRNVVEDQYRHRIEKSLLSWFPRSDLSSFWMCLRDSNGVIGGLVALNAVVAIENINRIDIFVPNGKEVYWHAFLISLGWNHAFSDSSLSRAGGVFETQWWKRPGNVSLI